MLHLFQTLFYFLYWPEYLGNINKEIYALQHNSNLRPHLGGETIIRPDVLELTQPQRAS